MSGGIQFSNTSLALTRLFHPTTSGSAVAGRIFLLSRITPRAPTIQPTKTFLLLKKVA